MKKIIFFLIIAVNAYAKIELEKSLVEKIIYVESKGMYKVTIKNQATDYYSKLENYLCLKKSLSGNEVSLEVDPITLVILKCSTNN